MTVASRSDLASSSIAFPNETDRAPRVSGAGRLRRVVIGIVITGCALTGAIGLLHLPAAAPLLRWLSPSSVCPLTRGTPEQIDRAHGIAGASIRRVATSPAPARPALGFALDTATKADLDAWSSAHGISCRSIGGNATLQKCANVPAAAVGHPETFGPLEEVSFEFRSTGELVSVQTLYRHLTTDKAAAIASLLEQSLATDLGPPSSAGGEPTAAHLAHGPLSTYVVTHAFSDYRATVSATNLASTGVMVREQYISARP